MTPVWLTLALAAAPSGQVEQGTPDAVNIVKARAQSAARAFEWNEWSKATFERAKREHKPLLIDCAAEWCHWCHVMDETTYRDPKVGALIASAFIAVRVDIDQRPDLAERYGDWGWPATILLSPDAQELGKERGYVPPAQLLEVLERARTAAVEKPEAELPGVPVEKLGEQVRHALERLDFYWDERDGSWGLRRKVPIGMNVVYLLGRGDAESKRRALLTLRKEEAILDPVWGGIYQYSQAEDWSRPHFEKLATYQAENLEAYAAGGKAVRRDADHLVAYIAGFLTAPDGTFYVNQDADLNAHNPGAPFVDGATYYRLDDAHRRALGVPWVDTHVYARENGMLISALLAHHRSTGSADSLTRAVRAAEVLSRTHLTADGAVKHEADSKGPYFLSDAASLGLAFARLGEVTHDKKWSALADRIASRMLELFAREGALYDSTPDPDAQGVFAHRRSGFGPNVAAARLLAATHREARGKQVLAALGGTERLDGEFAWVGEWLLAARELGVAER
ncbi:MAG: DUF255 domain-containing protein [Myxococcaceae bacterium]